MKIVNSNYVISHETNYMLRLLAEEEYLAAQGTTVYKEGARTGISSGVVSYTSAHLTYTNYTNPNNNNNVVIMDLLETSALSLPGDSGGVMYVIISGIPKIIGSMTATSYHAGSDEVTEESFICSYACKVGNAMNALNFSLAE